MGKKKLFKQTQDWMESFFARNRKIGLCSSCAHLDHDKNKPKCTAEENLKSYPKEKRLSSWRISEGRCSLWRPHYTFNEGPGC